MGTGSERIMTLLVTSIQPTDQESLALAARKAWADGADAVEIRLDAYEDDPETVALLCSAQPNLTWIITCRSADEGGSFRGHTVDRVARLLGAARNTNALVDFELSDWLRSSNIRQKISMAAAPSDGAGSCLILSSHDFSHDIPDFSSLLRQTSNVPNLRCTKIAYSPKHIMDTFPLFDLLKQGASHLTLIAMGEDGLWTRVLAKKFGAFASYCALEKDEFTAPGQLTLDEMKHLYRWDRIDSETKVFGVIGDPTAQSLSPFIHNAWFEEFGIDAVYLPLRVRSRDDAFAEFMNACQRRPWLGLSGCSVTLPHKPAALSWAGDRADPMSHWIGAANTLHFTDAKVRAYNTDAYAAVESLVDALGCRRSDLANVTVDILGCGGAARAVAYGLYESGCRMTVYGRNVDKTKALADSFKAKSLPWDQRVNRSGELVMNTTSVGMWPDIDHSPLPIDSLTNCRLVFDLVYNPLETRLLREAAGAGAQTLNGLDMFTRQAAMQFAIWTGRTPDPGPARETLSNVIRQRYTKSP